MRGIVRQIAIVAAVAVNLILNGLAGAGMLFGVQTGAVSDAEPTAITPPGWAFGIWGVIFAGVAVFAVWQALPQQRSGRYDRLAVPFVAANLLNGFWQIPWLTGQFGIAALAIVGILVSLVVTYIRLDAMRLAGVERWTLGVPVSLWMAWLSVATPLNLTIWLQSLGWSPEGVVWPVALIGAVALIGGWVLLRTGDLAVAAVLLWAFTAIALRDGADSAVQGAIVVAWIVTVMALVLGARRYSLAPTAHAA